MRLWVHDATIHSFRPNRRGLDAPTPDDMLKLNGQLGRALRYQSALGTERAMGHFDDSAKDLAGPPNLVASREALSVRAVRARSLPNTRQLMVRVDPQTSSLVGYFADDEA